MDTHLHSAPKRNLSNKPLVSKALLSLIAIVSLSPFHAQTANIIMATSLERFELKPSAVVQYVELDASVEASQAATVAAQTSGRIIKLYYDVNDLVSQGAPLLEITSQAQGAELAGAEAELAKAVAINQEAQAHYQRVTTLFPQGAISKGALDEARVKAKTSEQAISFAKANLIKAKQTVDYTVVSAPFSGRVSERHVQQGETVTLGQGLFSGYDPQSLRIVFHLPQSLYSSLDANTLGQFSTYVKQTQISFENATVMAFADPVSHSHLVRLSLSQHPELMAALTPGQWLKVRVNLPATSKLLIPKSALISQGEFTGVYLFNGAKVHLTQVRVGQESQGQLQVLSGLMSGDNIAIDANLAQAFTRDNINNKRAAQPMEAH